MNVYLSANIGKKDYTKKSVLKRAWVLYRISNKTWSEALADAWSEAKNGIVTRCFSTNADIEDVGYTIYSCTENNNVRTDIISKWDSNLIKHQLDWVSYHLRRYGFEINHIDENDNETVRYDNIPVYLF